MVALNSPYYEANTCRRCISIGCGKFSLLGRKYVSLAVNVLTKSPKISNVIKRDIFQLNFGQSDETIFWKCCRADFSSVWDPLTCWLSKGVLKRGVLDIYLTTSLEVSNFGNTSAMRLIFFFKLLKIWCRFQNWRKKNRKKQLM